MKNKFIFLVLIIVYSQLSAQEYCIPHRFFDNYYFRSRDIQLDKDIVYGQAINYKGKSEILDLDNYYPKQSVDTLDKRPLIMLVHGGSYGDKSKMDKYCPLFAQRGFVVANINRRKGSKNNTEIEFMKECYRAVQDAHAALRFLVKNAEEYGIDTGAVFVGGVSAGALTSLGITYMYQQDFDNRYSVITESLGRMHNSTNELNTKFTIRGVIDMWGQIPDTSLISFEEAQEIPIIMFHSTADSSRSTYEKSQQIAKRFQNLDGCYQLHTKTGAGHTQGISKYYIAEQTGCFIKRILCDSCYSLEREVDNQNISCQNVISIDKPPYYRPHIELDSSFVAQYIGTYKFKDGHPKRRIIIKSENGHLFFKTKNSDFQGELFAESENDFSLRNDNAQISFIKAKYGKVSGLVFYIDAQEIEAKKIN